MGKLFRLSSSTDSNLTEIEFSSLSDSLLNHGMPNRFLMCSVDMSRALNWDSRKYKSCIWLLMKSMLGRAYHKLFRFLTRHSLQFAYFDAHGAHEKFASESKRELLRQHFIRTGILFPDNWRWNAAASKSEWTSSPSVVAKNCSSSSIVKM